MPTRPVAAPADLDAAGRALFRSSQRAMRERGHWHDGDAPLLAQYVRAVLGGDSRHALELADALALTPARRGERPEAKETTTMNPDALAVLSAINAAREPERQLRVPETPADESLRRLASAVADEIERRAGARTDETGEAA